MKLPDKARPLVEKAARMSAIDRLKGRSPPPSSAPPRPGDDDAPRQDAPADEGVCPECGFHAMIDQFMPDAAPEDQGAMPGADDMTGEPTPRG